MKGMSFSLKWLYPRHCFMNVLNMLFKKNDPKANVFLDFKSLNTGRPEARYLPQHHVVSTDPIL